MVTSRDYMEQTKGPLQLYPYEVTLSEFAQINEALTVIMINI